jgi:hypothetical protein
MTSFFILGINVMNAIFGQKVFVIDEQTDEVTVTRSLFVTIQVRSRKRGGGESRLKSAAKPKAEEGPVC